MHRQLEDQKTALRQSKVGTRTLLHFVAEANKLTVKILLLLLLPVCARSAGFPPPFVHNPFSTNAIANGPATGWIVIWNGSVPVWSQDGSALTNLPVQAVLAGLGITTSNFGHTVTVSLQNPLPLDSVTISNLIALNVGLNLGGNQSSNLWATGIATNNGVAGNVLLIAPGAATGSWGPDPLLSANNYWTGSNNFSGIVVFSGATNVESLNIHTATNQTANPFAVYNSSNAFPVTISPSGGLSVGYPDTTEPGPGNILTLGKVTAVNFVLQTNAAQALMYFTNYPSTANGAIPIPSIRQPTFYLNETNNVGWWVATGNQAADGYLIFSIDQDQGNPGTGLQPQRMLTNTFGDSIVFGTVPGYGAVQANKKVLVYIASSFGIDIAPNATNFINAMGAGTYTFSEASGVDGSTAIGSGAAAAVVTSTNSFYMGYFSGAGMNGSEIANFFAGTLSGQNSSSGNSNTVIGNFCDFPVDASTNQLNVVNLIWGRGANLNANVRAAGVVTVNNFLELHSTGTAPAGTFLPSGNDGMFWNSNKVVYWVTTTKTNVVSDGR